MWMSGEVGTVCIVGQGIVMPEVFQLASNLTIVPGVPTIGLQDAADYSQDFASYAAVLKGRDIGTFTLRVDGPPNQLAARAWNALWDFHLLSLAAEGPVSSLFSITDGAEPKYSSANRHDAHPVREPPVVMDGERLRWALNHKPIFDDLISNRAFSAGVRSYGNSHYLFDDDLRVMLVWSGIEGLLSVDAELNRRIALYAALMLEGTHEEKVQWFTRVKKAYGVRSRVVHGSPLKREAVREGLNQANAILIRLLRRCVEIGRVPAPEELDALALHASIG
jgi:hypothetical protein